jgi:paraquat-inducible protein B
MAGAALDASATATRDPSEAGRKLLKEGGILTSQYAGDMLLRGGAAINTPINSAQNLLRSTIKSSGDLTAQTVGLVNENAGANVQLNVEAVNGANLVLNTGDTLLRGALTAAPGVAVKLYPLLNDDIRGDIVDKVTNGKPKEFKEGMERNVEELKKDIQKKAEELTSESPQKVFSTLRNTLAGLSMAASTAERNEPAPQIPSMNMDTSARSSVKEIVDSSEAYRAKMLKDAGR